MEMLNTLDVNIDTDKLLNLFDQSLVHLMKGFIKVTDDFKDYYKFQTFNIYVNDWALAEAPIKNEVVDNCRKMMLSNTKTISMKCYFLDLIASSKSFSSFTSQITIELTETSYSLVDATGTIIFTNLLEEQISPEIITSVLEDVSAKHLTFID